MALPVLARTVVATDGDGETYQVKHRSPLADVTAPAQADQLATTVDWAGVLLAVCAVVLDETGAEVYRTGVAA